MEDPLKVVVLIFTGGSSSGRAVCVVDGKGYVRQTGLASAQIVELLVVVVVFQPFANDAFMYQ